MAQGRAAARQGGSGAKAAAEAAAKVAHDAKVAAEAFAKGKTPDPTGAVMVVVIGAAPAPKFTVRNSFLTPLHRTGVNPLVIAI